MTRSWTFKRALVILGPVVIGLDVLTAMSNTRVVAILLVPVICVVAAFVVAWRRSFFEGVVSAVALHALYSAVELIAGFVVMSTLEPTTAAAFVLLLPWNTVLAAIFGVGFGMAGAGVAELLRRTFRGRRLEL